MRKGKIEGTSLLNFSDALGINLWPERISLIRLPTSVISAVLPHLQFYIISDI